MIKKYGSISKTIRPALRNPNLSDFVKNQIKDVVDILETASLDEIYKKACNIYDICPICNTKYFIFIDGKCPNIATETRGSKGGYGDKPYDQCNGKEKLHVDYRQANRAKNGTKVSTKRHKENDCFKQCKDCDDKDCDSRGIVENNKFLDGFGCLTKHNRTKEMREISSINGKNNCIYGQNAIKNLWNNDFEWAKNQSKICKENLKIAREVQKFLYNNDPEWSKERRDKLAESIKTAYEKAHWLWKNDIEWAEKQRNRVINSLIERQNEINEKLYSLIANQNISFNGNILNLDDFNNLKEIPGVWSLWGTNKETDLKECLTVGQTIDLERELSWTVRVLANEKLQELEEKEPGCTGRWDKIQANYTNYEYILVCENEFDIEIREIKEFIYASINNSLYWLPSISQLSNNFLEKLKYYINIE